MAAISWWSCWPPLASSMKRPRCSITASLARLKSRAALSWPAGPAMSFFTNLRFRLMYRRGLTPWDSGVPPPELIEVIEGARRLPAGRALDLGCGTGTTTVYMASNGWQVTGVDFVPRALRVARAKAAAARLPVAFLVGDVTRLHDYPIQPGFDLLFDQGCFHSLPEAAQPTYVHEVARMARSGATYLLYAFGRQSGER